MTRPAQLELAIAAPPLVSPASGKTRAAAGGGAVAAELVHADTAPIATIATTAAAAAAAAGPRRCAWCHRKLKKRARPDQVTCGKRCRQAKSRATAREQKLAARAQLPEVSRKTLTERRAVDRVLTRAAISYAGFSPDDAAAAPPVRRATPPRKGTREVRIG